MLTTTDPASGLRAPVEQSDRLGQKSTSTEPIRLGFVMHAMQVAGAEMLVARIIADLGPQIHPVIFCLDAVGALGERLQSQGIEVVCLDRRPGRDWGLVARFARLIREHRIELLHAHQYTPFFYTALARMWGRLPVKIIFTEHGRHFPDVVSGKRKQVNRWFLARQADAINACCQFSANALSEKDGFPAKRTEVIYNGIDVEEFSAAVDRRAVKQRLGIAADRRIIVTVARFHPVKDHATLIAAFAQVAVACDDVDLVLVGDGSLRADLESQVQQLGLVSRVQFWGVRRDVAEILQATDVFVLPSLSEAASLTLLEAMASGCPIVVTDVGGNPEIVRQEIDGLRVPRQAPEAMAKACLRFLNEAEFAERCGASAQTRVREKFRQSQTVADFARLYRQLATR